MKIAIDCRSLAWKHSGIARYLDNILLFLEKDKENTYYLLSPFKLSKKYKGNIKYITFNSNEIIYKYIDTPIFLNKEKINAYWSPTPELPFIKIAKCKYICTIHDVAFEHDISSSSWKVKVIHLLGLYKRSAKLADLIFTDSYYSKVDIEKTYNINENKIVVTYIGIDDTFKAIAKSSAKKLVGDKFGIQGKYIFYINTGRPTNLLIAFKKLLEGKFKTIEMQLVCLGKSINESEDIDNVAKSLGIENKVLYIKTFVDDITLNNLYSGAELFVCPSYFEGFGLTPLEALKSNTPVIISRNSALPEIFQDAAYYCNPNSPNSISEAIYNVYLNKTLQLKQLNKSKVLFKKYSWDTIGEKIVDVFEKTFSKTLIEYTN